jgi:S1-C subfamily serine protease
MMNCKNCGSSKLQSISLKLYQCAYCAETFEIERPTDPVHPASIKAFPYEKAEKGIIHLVSDSGSGTGFVIHSQGFVLTNKHVIEDLDIISGYLLNNPRKLELEVIGDGAMMGLDLALLKIIDVPDGLMPIPFSKKPIRISDTAYTIGNPKNLGTSLSKGTVSRQDNETLQCDLTVNAGNSGGPVLNENGECIGVISYKHEDIEGFAFAVPLEKIKSFLIHFKNQF